jgi:DNA repair protein RecN (Recombination protein N)
VTHTPQVAAAAQRHYRVSKRHGRDATMVDVQEISGEKRIDELADMLGGGAPARAQAIALMAGSGA